MTAFSVIAGRVAGHPRLATEGRRGCPGQAGHNEMRAPGKVMAAYGLYTHIQSNKRRSIALLIGLFFLVYVMVFAGALLAEALGSHDYLWHTAARLSRSAPRSSISSRPFHSPPSARSSGSRSPTNSTSR